MTTLAASYRHSATVQHNINLGHNKWMLECAEDIAAIGITRPKDTQ